MGNQCMGAANYVAKETFHPSDDAFHDLPRQKDEKGELEKDYEKHKEELKKEVPLKITMDDKLKMILETEFLGPGGVMLYKMKNVSTGQSGLVMSDMVAKIGTLECEKWFFGQISRRRALDYLQFDVNVNGAFLIRESEKKDGKNYALSLKSWQSGEQKFVYKHYLILQNEAGTIFNIKGAEKYKYSSLSELVAACKRNEARGLACLLTEECIKPRSQNIIGDSGGKWDIPRSELTKDKELGSGHFGIVYKGTWRGKVPVAIKQLRDDRVDTMPGGYEQAKNEFFKEMKVFQMVNHPNLVQVYAICIDDPPFLLVTEFLENGDLKGYLRKEEAKTKLTFDKLVRISENIASGIAALHQLNIVHRDLAARNVMLDKWLQAKVGDFGLAREGDEYAIDPVNEDGTKKKMELPWKWVAPEAATHKVFNEKSDVWAFGITLWEIFTFGAMPYPTMNNQDTLQAVQRGYRMEKPNYPGNTTPENLEAIYNVMLLCWNKQPEKRPPMSTLQQDLDDFGPALVESKYNYPSKEFMASEGLTNHTPGRGSKQDKRTKNIEERQRKIRRKKENPAHR